MCHASYRNRFHFHTRRFGIISINPFHFYTHKSSTPIPHKKTGKKTLKTHKNTVFLKLWRHFFPSSFPFPDTLHKGGMRPETRNHVILPPMPQHCITLKLRISCIYGLHVLYKTRNLFRPQKRWQKLAGRGGRGGGGVREDDTKTRGDSTTKTLYENEKYTKPCATIKRVPLRIGRRDELPPICGNNKVLAGMGGAWATTHKTPGDPAAVH